MASVVDMGHAAMPMSHTGGGSTTTEFSMLPATAAFTDGNDTTALVRLPTTDPNSASLQQQQEQEQEQAQQDHEQQEQQQPTQNILLHRHRLSHSASKLPAFRFADLKKDALVLPSRLPPMPPTPECPIAGESEGGDEKMSAARGAADMRKRVFVPVVSTGQSDGVQGTADAVEEREHGENHQSHLNHQNHNSGQSTCFGAPPTTKHGNSASSALQRASPIPARPSSPPSPTQSHSPAVAAPASATSNARTSTFQNPAAATQQKPPPPPLLQTQAPPPPPLQPLQVFSSSPSSTAAAITASSTVTAVPTATASSSPRAATASVDGSSASSASSSSSASSASIATVASTSTAPTPPRRPASFPDALPKVIVSHPHSNTTAAATPSSTPASPTLPTSPTSPVPTRLSSRLQRTLTEQSPSQRASPHRRPLSSGRSLGRSSDRLETTSSPPSAPAAKPSHALLVVVPPSSNTAVVVATTPTAPTAPTASTASTASAASTASTASTTTITAVDHDGQSNPRSRLSAPTTAGAHRLVVPQTSTKAWANSQRDPILDRSAHDTPTDAAQAVPESVQQDLLSQPLQPSADDRRKTATSRPPLSFRRPRVDASTSRVTIPPIRSFRSSGSRRSLGLDMNLQSPGVQDDADAADDGSLDARQRDRTLRALEGRVAHDDFLHGAANLDASHRAAPDMTGDVFMRIAREDPRHQPLEDGSPVDLNTASRAPYTSSQRRPFSAAVLSRQNTSPPQISRRLSDQRDTARQRRHAEEHNLPKAGTASRDTPPRALAYERVTPLRSATFQHRPEPVRTRTVVSASRPSPSTPRTSAVYDTASDVGTSYSRRRPSVSEPSNMPLPLRASSIKTSHAYARTYNSSPLVPRHADSVRPDGSELVHAPGLGIGMEGTESSASTVAPSNVWDELDDIKSRMRRLELSGKVPATSGAAMSRVSDERPRTATTNATTMSGSPKRGANSGQATDARSTTSSSQQQQQPQQNMLQSPSQRDAQQPILLSALQKARALISDDVYTAIETAATEALSLSQLFGVTGQPGPISSGASAIGTSLPATVTDRQLRRKAENICRTLTELCFALNDEAIQRKVKTASAALSHVRPATEQLQQQQQQPPPPAQHHPQLQPHGHLQHHQTTLPIQAQAEPQPREDAVSVMASPTMTTNKAFASLASARRSAAEQQQPLAPKGQISPRVAARIEDRRASFLSTPTLPTQPTQPTQTEPTQPTLPAPRFALAPPVSSENAGRRSSLLISRTRRATSEEPEEAQLAGRRSSLLRTRRAGTEEPEEARKSSLLVRPRRTLALAKDDDDDGRRLRSPSRAVTEVAMSWATPRDYPAREYAAREYPTTREYSTREYTVREYPAVQQLHTSSTAPQVGAAGANAAAPPTSPTTGEPPQPLASSALPRRRLVPFSLNSRLVTPQTTTTSVTTSSLVANRRFLDHGASERDDAAAAVSGEKLVEDRAQRPHALGQTSLATRAGSMNRRLPRETTLPSLSSAASQVGGYR